MAEQKSNEVALPPGQYAYLQDISKGNLKVCVGPMVINKTGQDEAIVYNDVDMRFEACPALSQSVRFSPIAVEGAYMILRNPAVGDKHPAEGQQAAPELQIGRSVNVPGPVTFALWPAQTAKVIPGHQLRSNQYLVVRVYNEAEARKNWSTAVVKGAGEADAALAIPSDLSVGRQLIIKGTEVSFYIPPTGIEVVAQQLDTLSNSRSFEDEYVRDALTLEQLEYSILVGEDGTKRYEKGPQVVFPDPTEKFIDDNKGNIKFRAIELNALQGLHIKVIAPYKEGDNEFKEGEELFITGADTQIYYPREEHSLITYDGNQKHFAVAIPPGEARYVMNRLTGEIRTERGPKMLLPNPVFEVIVRRHLTDRESQALYPNNAEALEYNRQLRQIAQKSPTTRSGVVSEGDLMRSGGSHRDIRGGDKKSLGASGFAAMESQATAYLTSNAVVGAAAPAIMPKSNINNAAISHAGDEITRSSSYTQPRSLVFGGKFEGVPTIKLFTGYAIMIVNAAGERRVVQGPAVIQLEYDETVEIMTLSTGKPKTMDNTLQTPYLRMVNNKVSDIFDVETSDHVGVNLKVSHVVNFEGEPRQWFAIENYVKFLCDHIRSVVKAAVKKISIEQFYQNATDLIRNIATNGDTDNGYTFHQNGMRLTDIEVLEVQIRDPHVAKLLTDAQRLAVQSNIQLAQSVRQLDFIQKTEEIDRQVAVAKAETRIKSLLLDREQIIADLTAGLAKLDADVKRAQKRQEQATEEAKVVDIEQAAALARSVNRDTAVLELEEKRQANSIAMLKEETAAAVQRFNAAQGQLSEALLALSSQETLVKIANANSVQNILGGENLVDVLGRIFKGGELESLLKKVTDKVVVPTNGTNGKSTPQHV